MKIDNVEIKARCAEPLKVEKWLLANGAEYKGVDHQEDTYYQIPEGRLKLREGNIEKNLIYYNRPDQAGAKHSKIRLVSANEGLKEVLMAALPVLVVVKKARKIFFIDHVKFHIDHLENLGDFVEIEVIDTTGTLGVEKMTAQLHHYQIALGIQASDLLTHSYSDMLLSRI